MEAAAIKREESIKRLNPQLFSLWVGMASMLMLFGAFTSAYLVKQGAGNWLQFSIPPVFFLSTLTIVVSSVVLHLGYNAYVNRSYSKYKTYLLVSTLLGLTFVVCQYLCETFEIEWYCYCEKSSIDYNGLRSNIAGRCFEICA